MKTSKNGIELIKKFEGCVLVAYRCPAGKPTIGYGHTEGVRMGQRITMEQAERFLQSDLQKYEMLVNKYASKYNWNQNQFDALVSFAYNIGSIDGLTNNGKRDSKTISEKILKYNKITVNGKKVVSKGISERRAVEKDLFLSRVQEEPSNIQAAEASPVHVQMNYQPGHTYTVAAEGLRIRSKKANQDPIMLPTGSVIGKMKNGKKVKNLATARVGSAIWMYIGLDKTGREQWICADTGSKAYII